MRRRNSPPKLILTPKSEEQLRRFFGESNVGKTQICYTLSGMVQLGRHRWGLDGKAIYIDTESTFRRERIESIVEAKDLDTTKATKSIIIARSRVVQNRSIIWKWPVQFLMNIRK